MITEIVLFDLPPGLSRTQLLEMCRQTAPGWRANPYLLRMHYLHDPERGTAGGVYVWRNREAARHWNEAFRAEVEARIGSRLRVMVFETPVLVDNQLGDTLEAEPAAGWK